VTRRVATTLAESMDAWGDGAPDRDGLSTWVRGGDRHWQHRHSPAHRGRDPGDATAQVCATGEWGVPKFRCRCDRAGRCCEHANAEDGLCEPCRRWCP
jgi:hypothetical protein